MNAPGRVVAVAGGVVVVACGEGMTAVVGNWDLFAVS